MRRGQVLGFANKCVAGRRGAKHSVRHKKEVTSLAKKKPAKKPAKKEGKKC